MVKDNLYIPEIKFSSTHCIVESNIITEEQSKLRESYDHGEVFQAYLIQDPLREGHLTKNQISAVHFLNNWVKWSDNIAISLLARVNSGCIFLVTITLKESSTCTQSAYCNFQQSHAPF